MLSRGSGLPSATSRSRTGRLLVVIGIDHLLATVGKVAEDADDILHTLVVHVVLVDGASDEIQ